MSEPSQQEQAAGPHAPDENNNNINASAAAAPPRADDSPSLAPAPPQTATTTLQNPFRHKLQPGSTTNITRQHFPGFDRAMFGSDIPARSPVPSLSSSAAGSAQHLNNRSSNASSSAAGGSSHASSSTLNMSIGARAALNDHLRHIAKFGLDESDSGNNSSGNNSPQHGHQKSLPQKETSALTPPRNPLDAMWNQLLDTHDTTNLNLSPASSSSSSNTNTAAKNIPGVDRIDTVVSVSSGEIEGSDAIEVSPKAAASHQHMQVQQQQQQQQQQHMQVQQQQQQQQQEPISLFPWEHYYQDDNQSKSSKSSSSFFNTSRVNMLLTPERNYAPTNSINQTDDHQSPPTVTLRHACYEPTSPSILEDSTIADHASDIPMAHLFHALTTGVAAHHHHAHQMEAAAGSSSSPQPLDSSFGSFGIGLGLLGAATDLSRISGYGASPDSSFQQQSSQHAQQPHRPLFSSWDDEDEVMHQHASPFLEGPSPPPPPPPPSRSTSQGVVFYPTQQQWRDTSWASLPSPRIQQRSLSPPPTRRPLLQKQYSCPVSSSNKRHSSPIQMPFQHKQHQQQQQLSVAAQKAGWMALAQQHGQEDEQRASSPPTHTLLDFFQDYSSPHQSTTPVLFQSPPGDIHAQQPSVDDISTIQNDSSSGGQHNISSSSSSNKRATATTKTSVGVKQQQQQQQKLATTIATTPATADLNKSTLSSSSSSSAIHPIDRRRYRTVVPSRVFLKEEPKEGYFPVARDSFSSDDPGKKVLRRRSTNSSIAAKQLQDDEESSLLHDSFEAAHQFSLLEEPQKHQQQHQQQP